MKSGQCVIVCNNDAFMLCVYLSMCVCVSMWIGEIFQMVPNEMQKK